MSDEPITPRVEVTVSVTGTTRHFTPQELDELVEKADEIASRPWRHGRHVTYVVEADGAHWRFEVPEHHDEGWQADGGVTAVKVAQFPRTVLVWEPCA